MSKPETYDFSGWATKNDLRCADGRVIRSGAFSVNDGKAVPLVWNHQHNSASDVLGHAILENRPEGVFAYGVFNNTQAGKDAKECVKHGDVVSLSIWANNLQQVGSEVFHGVIREVSLVLAGANPGAFIESVVAHGEAIDEFDEEGIFYTGDNLLSESSEEVVAHSEESGENEEKEEVIPEEGSPEEIIEHSDTKKGDNMAENKMDIKDGETVGDVFDTLSDKQKLAVAAIINDIVKGSKGEGEEVKHNIFDNETENVQTPYLSHADMEAIFKEAKKGGSLREAVYNKLGDDAIMHSIDTTGMDVAVGESTYGFNDPDMLFPDYRATSATPEWISRRMEWVDKVMRGVHRTPFSRIKSMYANITEDEARAKGYVKGKQKLTEVFTTLKRTTDPQTIYKLQKMDRDDIIDITDFDVVAWIRQEMRIMLDEEIARAILIGDGRLDNADDKIQESHVRPIAKDVPLYNTVVQVDLSEDGALAIMDAAITARKNYKGSGNPTFFTTEDVLSSMLVIRDTIGHRMYKSEAEVASAMRVKDIVTVEPFEGQTIEVSNADHALIGIIVNLNDYNVGADKGGAVNMFDDFDIDYNRYSYLIETRISGALTKPFSALTLIDKAESV